jgi:hypothetical protein
VVQSWIPPRKRSRQIYFVKRLVAVALAAFCWMLYGSSIGSASAQGLPERYSCQPPPNLKPGFGGTIGGEFDRPLVKVGDVKLRFTLILGDNRQIGILAMVAEKFRPRVLELTDKSISFQRKRLDNGRWSPFNRCKNGTDRVSGEAGNHVRLAFVILSNSRHHFRAVYTGAVMTKKGIYPFKVYVPIV